MSCVASTNDDAWLCHRRLGHTNMGQLSKLSKGDFIHGLPKIDFKKDRLCDTYQYGKQIKSSIKSKEMISTTKPLELIHIDLFGLIRTLSLGGKRYIFVLVDDFSRFT